MALYDYQACSCGKEAGVRMCKMDDRDAQTCDCGAALVRDGVSEQGGFFFDKAFQHAAKINGQTIKSPNTKKGLRWM